MHTQQPHRPFCEHCKTSLAKANGKSKHGFQLWHKYCSTCAKIAYNKRSGFLLHKKHCCENCGFIAVDQCQLDIVDNKTYCANCSRLYRKQLRDNKHNILDITVDTDATI